MFATFATFSVRPLIFLHNHPIYVCYFSKRKRIASVNQSCGAPTVSAIVAPRAPSRLWPASGRITDGLVLGFRIEVGTDQHHDDRKWFDLRYVFVTGSSFAKPRAIGESW
jgi:hypothetical protein